MPKDFEVYITITVLDDMTETEVGKLVGGTLVVEDKIDAVVVVQVEAI